MTPLELNWLGFDHHDGLLAAWVPTVDRVPLQHDVSAAGRDRFSLFSQDGVVIDGQSPDGRAVKWWRVRDAARECGLDVIEPLWHGAAADFDLAWDPGNRPRPSPEHKLCIRAYSRGPWIALESSEADHQTPTKEAE